MQIAPLIRNTVTRCFLAVIVVLCFGGVASGLGPTIQPVTPPDGDVQMNPGYSLQLTASDLALCCTWSLASGSGPLPVGLGLNPDSGLISGTPTSQGTFTFTVQASDILLSDTKQLTITINAELQITTTSPLPGGTQGIAYSAPLAASGGSGTYTWSLVSVNPSAPWLSVSGAALTALSPLTGNYDVTVQVTDSITAVRSILTLVISPPPLIVTTASLPAGEATAAYPPPTGAGVTLTATGGTPPYTWALANTSAPLPLNLSISTSGVISGTLAATATTVSNIIVQVTDTNSVSATSQALTLTVNPEPSITTASALPQGEVEVVYQQVNLAATGGSGSGYTFALANATALPQGLLLNSGVISGTPTAAGPFSFTLRVTDSAGGSSTKDFALSVVAAPVITTTSPLPLGEAGAPYQQVNLSATGGSGSGYTFALANATSMPPQLQLSNAGAITGIPNSPGTFNFTVKVTDSAGGSSTQNFAVTIVSGPSITNGPTLPSGTVNAVYSGVTLMASDGTAPYSWSITIGALPANLILNGSTGAITGTPIAQGTFNFTAQVTDAKGVTGSKQFTITIANGLIITNAPTMPTGEVNVTYSQTFIAAGGTPSYTWSTIGGALPGGLGLNSATGVLSGPPNGSGTFTFTVQVQDANGVTASQQFTLTIAPQLAINTAPNLPGGSTGTFYSQTISASGGVTPYSWSITIGALPANLILNGSTGAITGTPIAQGTFNFTAQVTDAKGVTGSKQFTITIANGLIITNAPTMPTGEVNVTYSQTFIAAGGTPSYTWSTIGGALPGGLGLNSATGVLSGPPNGSGTFTFTVQVQDANGVTASQQFTLTIAPQLAINTAPNLPSGSTGTFYSQTISASGGVTPYSWSITLGALPAGMTLNASSGVISGTPTNAGTFNFTAQVTDRASVTANKQFTLQVTSGLVISTPSTLPSGSIGTFYSQYLSAAGGTKPYRWSVSAGSLPAGLTLFAENGGIAGRPISAGTFTFTLQVIDNASVTARKDFTLTIAGGLIIATPSPLPDGVVGKLYSQPLTAAGGSTPYHWLVVAGTIPSGLLLNPATGAISGTPTTGGNFNFGVQVTDNASANSTKNFSISIVSSLVITTTSLPDSTVGGTYSQTVVVSGGKPPYAWSTSAGAIAPGLSLSPSDGTITGSPKTAGTFTFT
ncbi:MAG: hypothetical protein DMG57_44250, partial [Acidobacteria bacterium]